MVGLPRGELDRRKNVILFQIREVPQDLCFGRTGGQHVQGVFDPDALPSNARPPTTLLRVDRYAIQATIHGCLQFTSELPAAFLTVKRTLCQAPHG
jgi:hypothetical protein